MNSTHRSHIAWLIPLALLACLAASAIAAGPAPAQASPPLQFSTPTEPGPTTVPTEPPPTPPEPPTPPGPIPTDTPGGPPVPPAPGTGSKRQRGGGPAGALAVPEGPAPTKFGANGCAVVVRPPALSLHESPGFESPFLLDVAVGDSARVIGGPVGFDNLWWWQFRAPGGQVGWGVGDYADPSSGPCVAPVAASVTGKIPKAGLESQWPIAAALLALLMLVVMVLRRVRPPARDKNKP